MSEKRLRVHENTRRELRGMRRDSSETYSDVLDRILPRNVDENVILKDEGEMVVIPVSQEVHDRALELAGKGVSVGSVVDFYLYKQKVEQTIPANQLLEELYKRSG